MEKQSLERVKTAVLIFLFLMNLVLISFHVDISDKDIFKFKKEKDMAKIDNMVEEIIQPDSGYVHFGGGNNTILKSNLKSYWRMSVNSVKQPVEASSSLTEIGLTDYENKKELKSIQFNFSKDIDPELVAKSMGLQKTILSKIKGIREILIPFVDDKRIYFLSSSQRVYYIENEYYEDLLKLSSRVKELEKTSYKRYYSIDSFFTDLTNKTLVSVEGEDSIPYYRSESLLKLEDEEVIKNLAKIFFKDKFDFTNRVVESSGANTFIYGYGSKVLRIDPNGYVEYKNEQIKSDNTDVKSGIEKAVELIDELGIRNIYLRQQKEISIRNKKAQYYGFSYRIGNYNLISQNIDNEIEIVVLGDEIYSYKSILKARDSVIPRDINLKKVLSFEEIVLSKNLALFSTTQGYVGFEADEVSRKILENIKRMELSYFMDDSNIFTPSWYLEMGNIYYIFDAYTGERLDYGLVKN